METPVHPYKPYTRRDARLPCAITEHYPATCRPIKGAVLEAVLWFCWPLPPLYMLP